MSDDLAALRRVLHRHPELSGQERETAARMAAEMAGADEIVTGLGGHGVAAVIAGTAPGPTVLLRAELDALPIEEGATPLRSEVAGVAHLCGHDGHMTMLVGAARALMRDRPARGRVVVLFQPAEEDGSGARAVAADPRFAPLRPDWAFALHNKPGQPLGAVAVGQGPTTCASRGMRVTLRGRTAHASEPDRGLSPMGAMVRLMPALADLGPGGAPGDPGYGLATVTHARLGAAAFGVAPGEAEILCTLRAVTDAEVDALAARAEALARDEAARAGLSLGVAWQDDFAATHATARAASLLREVADSIGLGRASMALPMRGSEDFGALPAPETALAFIGTGEGSPLHAPDYTFPDELLPLGAALLEGCARRVLSGVHVEDA